MAKSKRSVEKEVFWRSVLEQQRRSGLSVRKFCQHEALSEPSFYAWRRALQQRLSETVADGNGLSRLIPVEIVPATRQNVAPLTHPGNQPLEIATPRGFTLRFAHDTSSETISRLLDVMTRCAHGGSTSC